MKINFKKVMSTVMAVLLIPALVSGCGSSSSEPAVSTQKDPAAPVGQTDNTSAKEEKKEKTKLVWWTFQRHDMEYMQAMVEKFNNENTDGIEIEYVIQSENFRQSLDLVYQSNQAPDIFTGQDNAKYYVDKGQVVALDTYLTDDLKARYGELLYTENDNGVDGAIYSLPNTGITYRLIVNNDLLKKSGYNEPPKDLASLVEMAKTITQNGVAEKEYGFAINLKNTQTAVERSINVIGMKSGFTYYDFVSGLYNFTPYKPIVEAFSQMVKDGSVMPGYESLDIDPLRSQFANGKIGMYFSGSWEPGVYADQFPTEADWSAVPVPTIDGTVKGPANITGLKWMYISNQAKDPELCWKVLEYFNSDEIQVPYAEKGYGNPVVPTVIEKMTGVGMAGMEFFTPTKEDTIWPTRPVERTLTIEGQPFNDIFAKVIMGEADFDKEVDALNTKYNSALEASIKEGKIQDYKDPSFNPMNLIK